MDSTLFPYLGGHNIKKFQKLLFTAVKKRIMHHIWEWQGRNENYKKNVIFVQKCFAKVIWFI
ncbi:hypothetical protein DKP78_17565 [Enterococcus faecium]|nr:hypothetical protein DKP78_17565 [Enterococcus faecium]